MGVYHHMMPLYQAGGNYPKWSSRTGYAMVDPGRWTYYGFTPGIFPCAQEYNSHEIPIHVLSMPNTLLFDVFYLLILGYFSVKYLFLKVMIAAGRNLPIPASYWICVRIPEFWAYLERNCDFVHCCVGLDGRNVLLCSVTPALTKNATA